MNIVLFEVAFVAFAGLLRSGTSISVVSEETSDLSPGCLHNGGLYRKSLSLCVS